MKMVSASKMGRIAKAIGGGRCLGHHLLHRRSISYAEEFPTARAPVGFLPVYVGEERERFVIPTGFLSHPLFKVLLEKAYLEYGFDQRTGLSLPCTVSVFHEVVAAVKHKRGQFHLEKVVEEFAK